MNVQYLIQKSMVLIFYSDILFTSKKNTLKNPQSVKNMRDASLKGWKYAFEHIEETAKLIQKKYNVQKKSLAALMYEGQELKKLAYFKTKELGKIDKNKIQRIFDIYNVMGYVSGKINLEDLIFTFKDNSLNLSKEEQSYLDKKESIKICILTDDMPYSKISDGKFIGMAAEYVNIISTKLDMKFELIPTKTWDESLKNIKEKKCDLLPLTQETPNRKKYLNFTDTYQSTSLIITTTNDKIFISNIKNIIDKKLSIRKDCSFIELLKTKYPNINLVKVDSTKDALQKVLNGEVYGYIGTLASTAYEIQKNFLGRLKISGSIGDEIALKTALNKDDPILLSILNKSINTITEEQKQIIFNKYLSVNVQKGIDYTLIWQLIFGFIIVISIISLFILKQNKHKKELQKSKEQIHQYMNLMVDGFAIMKLETKKIVFCNNCKIISIFYNF